MAAIASSTQAHDMGGATGAVPRELRSVGDRFPTRRDGERQREPAFEVGLLEHGERGRGAIRDKQRVEEIIVTIEGRVGGDELDADGLLTPDDDARRDHDMVIGSREIDGSPVDHHRFDLGGRRAKIENQRRFGILQRQGDRDPAGNRIGSALREHEVDVVFEGCDRGGAISGQVKCDARHWSGRRAGGREQHHRQSGAQETLVGQDLANVSAAAGKLYYGPRRV